MMLNLKSIDVKSVSDISDETFNQCLKDTGLIVKDVARFLEVARNLVAEKNQSHCGTSGLCDFKEQFGHYHMPRKYAANPKLGKWVNTQRCNYKLYQDGQPILKTAEPVQELESIEFDWETSQTDWSVVRLQ
jgi:hypothetical protein